MRPIFLAAGVAGLLVAACGSGGEEAAKQTAALLAELPAPYNSGNVASGKQLFSQCAACHTVAKDGASGVGPNLYGVFGAKAASKPGFAYSPALQAAGWTWDAAHLDQWIAGPQAMLPGSKMAFVGLKDERQRRDVIAYLKVATSGGPQ
jgi:cytochrome c